MDWCHHPLSFGKASHVLTIRHIMCHDRFSNPKVKRSHWWNSVLQVTPWYLQFQTPHGTWPEPILGVPKDNRNFQRAEASPSQNVASRSLNRRNDHPSSSSSPPHAATPRVASWVAKNLWVRDTGNPKRLGPTFLQNLGFHEVQSLLFQNERLLANTLGFFTLTLNSHLSTVRYVSLIPWW